MDLHLYIAADCQFDDSTERVVRNEATVREMNNLPGTSLPGSHGTVEEPKAVLMLGDIVQWPTSPGHLRDYHSVYKDCEFPVMAAYGNHDQFGGTGDPQVIQMIQNAIRTQVIDQPDGELSLLTNVDYASGHYSWDWAGIHFINLNDHPGGYDPRQKREIPSERRVEARNSLAFLYHDLKQHVEKDQPVVICHHVGFTNFSLHGWWSQDERDAYAELTKSHNVIGIFTGHTHRYFYHDEYLWDGKRYEIPPALTSDAATYWNSVQGFLVVQIKDDTMNVFRRYTDDDPDAGGSVRWEWGEQKAVSFDRGSHTSTSYTLLDDESLGSCSWVAGRYGIVGVDSNQNAVLKTYWTRDWTDWENLGHPKETLLEPYITAVSWETGRYGVYALGEDGSVYQRWRALGDWSDWESIDLPASALKGPLAATNWAAYRFGVYGVATDGKLYGRHYKTSSWDGSWEDLGKPDGTKLAGALTAIKWAERRYGIYALGEDGKVYQKWWAPTGWSGWKSMGAPDSPVADLSSACWTAYRYAIYATCEDGKVYQKWYGTGSWSGWKELGKPSNTTLNGPITATHWAEQAYGLYARGDDGDLYQKWWRSSWSDWSPIDGLTAPEHGPQELAGWTEEQQKREPRGQRTDRNQVDPTDNPELRDTEHQ